jgi:hypothetical protein
MAKKKATRKAPKKTTEAALPSVETSPIGDKPEPKPSVDVHIPPVEPKVSALICRIDVPLAPITPHGYMADQIDMRGGRLTRKQRENLKRLTRGLDDAGAKLDSGKPIVYPIDAVRFVLERLG